MTPEQRKLNIGCGYRKLEDHWNVDKNAKCNPNQVLDLDVVPWPYEDDFFERITANYTLNYLGHTPENFVEVLKEMYRVSAPGAEWCIRTIHPRCDTAVDDFFQRRIITPKTMMMMDQKFNFESLAKKTGDSVFGFDWEIDIEMKDISPNLLPTWTDQLQKGMIGTAQLELEAAHKSNVVESWTMFFKIHKPQRFADWYRNQARK